jgi:hypothetical protein
MKVIEYAMVKATLLPIKVVTWLYNTPGVLTLIRGDDGKDYLPDQVWSQSKKDYFDIVESQADNTFDPKPWEIARG